MSDSKKILTEEEKAGIFCPFATIPECEWMNNECKYEGIIPLCIIQYSGDGYRNCIGEDKCPLMRKG